MSRTITRSPQDSPEAGQNSESVLSHGLKQRHLSMIALGGVIGAGLFVGSGVGIAAAGPAIVLLFMGTGALVMLIMRMLGEMSAARPSTGSFSVHAEEEIGSWAGTTSGWMYWLMLCAGVAAEATAAGTIMHSWVSFIPAYGWVALFMVFFCASNLTAVKNFGEFEFWFSAVKVAAIVAFLVLGLLGILGVFGSAPGTSHLTGHGGFFPTGVAGLAAGLLTTISGFAGLETVTIAAAESDNPSRNVARAVRTAVWRIAVFYIGSMAVVVTLVPWNDPKVAKEGPYVTVLDQLGIPAAGTIMQIVVLVALLSAMNANIYGSSRMAYSLVNRGQGPRFLGKVTRGVPAAAVLASCVFGFAAVIAGIVWPTTVFAWLLNIAGCSVLVVWSIVCLTQLKMRRRLERESPELLSVRMWGFPYLTWLTLAAILGVFAVMASNADGRHQLIGTAVVVAVLAGAGHLKQRRDRRAAESA
ncbi:amino acid permease [Streptomyces sp. Je 1-4]|uniref:amino acid permease n=1 Tax=Streptomyces TaxID=1883 RepID=UPI00140F17F9|nr:MULTISPECIES: amino acid permease [unclassified Streptomyces]QIK05338.1 amino acid permease [Streptomyces sp. ID38640]UYB38540.1 amino acid permease [Streptomyces sp. Je 1-4]UZQ34503.1 amino acid permease [Streptomyces sp. Je 1-4] [Streptomyces sp. Je 1-4 4N24]UZQ41921.1 amino acid permease [Streptomyces sp. Je 1-4] [Streptomyces sp. Je 1-4 4N24_ara]